MEVNKSIDKRRVLDNAVFGYRASKDGKVFITWNGKPVKTLKDDAATAFLKKVQAGDKHQAQLVMAKLTGNFKRGNEQHRDGD